MPKKFRAVSVVPHAVIKTKVRRCPIHSTKDTPLAGVNLFAPLLGSTLHTMDTGDVVFKIGT